MTEESWTRERLAEECQNALAEAAADPAIMARLPASVRRDIERAVGAPASSDVVVESEPWSIELLRRMTRSQFNARVKTGDLPPFDLAAQLLNERLRVAASKRAR